MKGVEGKFDGSSRDSLCHSSILNLFQDGGIESRVPGDSICILTSFLMDIATVAGVVLLSAGLHMAIGECGSPTLHLPLMWQQLCRL